MSSSPPPGAEWSGTGSTPRGWFGPARPRRSGPAPVAPLSDPLVPPDLRGWFDRVAAVVRRSLIPLLLVQVAVAVIDAVVGYALLPDADSPAVPAAPIGGGPAGIGPLGAGPATAGVPPFDGGSALLGMAILVAVGVFAQGASVFVAIRDAAGRPVTASEAARFAAARAPALLGWGLAAGLLTGLGLLAIVPGVYLAVVFGSSLAGVVTVERRGISRCFDLVNNRLGPTAGRMLLVAAAALAYVVVAGWVVDALSQPASFHKSVLGAVIQIPMSLAAVGVAVVTYAELRFHERGDVFTSTLADELAR